MRKFEFSQTYEPVEIAGKEYRIEFNDEKIKQYYTDFAQFQKDIVEFEKINASDLPQEEQLQHFDDMKKVVGRAVESLLGEGTFDEIYENAGHSIMNVMDLVYFMSEVVEERASRNREDKRKKYIKGKK